MAKAFECDRCKVTVVGEPKQESDLAVLGTDFILRFAFGMKRPEAEAEELRAKLAASPMARMGMGEIDDDDVAQKVADLCDPCRSMLLREAVSLAGLDLVI